MITTTELKAVCAESLALIEASGIPINDADRAKITAADFGLSRLRKEGIQILTMYETERAAGKILVLLPYQTEPEHWHPSQGDNPGKEEIIRAVSGDLYFYVEGEDNMTKGFIPEGKEAVYTLRNEIDLQPGDQLVFPPDTPHWFQAGPRGAVMFSFSTKVVDNMDGFTDPAIQRETIIVEG
ncbi:MAG: D-lyxose/D-mannose family sugar isomerase [Bacteroidota bacterium]